MEWTEITHNGPVKYLRCKQCKDYPALILLCDQDEVNMIGPFCQKCWYAKVDVEFDMCFLRNGDND